MKVVTRLAVVVGWTLCSIILLGFLLLVFTFGDCEPEHAACIGRQKLAGQIVTLVVLGIYAVGLGLLVKRWFFTKAR